MSDLNESVQMYYERWFTL